MAHNAVEYLKKNIDVRTLLEHYNARKIHGTHKIRCCCPIHGGDNPTAFVYDTQRKLWYCHTGCKTGGDVFDFVMLMEHISFAEAVQYVADMFNYDISNMSIETRTIDYIQETKQWIQQMLKKTIVSELEEYDITQLGTLYKLNSYRNFTKETLEYFGVRYCQSATIYDIINNRELHINKRIVVPVYQNKILVGVTMRRTINEPVKWIHQPNGIYMGNYIYNIDSIQNITQPLMIVEGTGDVWNAHQNGYTNVVGMFGSHMTEQQEALLITKTYNIILALDPDYAGIKAMQDIYKRLCLKMSITFLNVPIHSDVGDLNKEKTESLINNTLTYSQWQKLEHVNDIIEKNMSMKGWKNKYKVGG